MPKNFKPTDYTYAYTYQGDQETANNWLAYAKGWLYQMISTNSPFRMQVLNPTSDVEVTIRKHPNQIFINANAAKITICILDKTSALNPSSLYTSPPYSYRQNMLLYSTITTRKSKPVFYAGSSGNYWISSDGKTALSWGNNVVYAGGFYSVLPSVNPTDAIVVAASSSKQLAAVYTSYTNFLVVLVNNATLYVYGIAPNPNTATAHFQTIKLNTISLSSLVPSNTTFTSWGFLGTALDLVATYYTTTGSTRTQKLIQVTFSADYSTNTTAILWSNPVISISYIGSSDSKSASGTSSQSSSVGNGGDNILFCFLYQSNITVVTWSLATYSDTASGSWTYHNSIPFGITASSDTEDTSYSGSVAVKVYLNGALQSWGVPAIPFSGTGHNDYTVSQPNLSDETTLTGTANFSYSITMATVFFADYKNQVALYAIATAQASESATYGITSPPFTTHTDTNYTSQQATFTFGNYLTGKKTQIYTKSAAAPDYDTGDSQNSPAFLGRLGSLGDLIYSNTIVFAPPTGGLVGVGPSFPSYGFTTLAYTGSLIGLSLRYNYDSPSGYSQYLMDATALLDIKGGINFTPTSNLSEDGSVYLPFSITLNSYPW